MYLKTFKIRWRQRLQKAFQRLVGHHIRHQKKLRRQQRKETSLKKPKSRLKSRSPVPSLYLILQRTTPQSRLQHQLKMNITQ